MFKGIEGLRHYLAWTVVLSHIVLNTGLPSAIPATMHLARFGNDAVMVFIIISGFVITNLVVTKQELYGAYITRRFLRIYPAYLVALAAGALVTPLGFEALSEYRPLGRSVLDHFSNREIEHSLHSFQHMGLHLVLLHGAVPNNVLNEAQYMYLGPAWSLSLEWQFYLIAPAFILMVRRCPAASATLVLLGLFAYERGAFGKFYNPSFLPGAGHLFLLGIASRLQYERLPVFDKFPWALMIGSAAALAFSMDLLPLLIWAGMLAYIRQPKIWSALDGAMARTGGKYSYSVYIIHQPVYLLISWISLVLLTNNFWENVAFVAVGTLVGTAIAAWVLFTLFENPFNQFGRRLGRQTSQATNSQPS